MRTGLRLSAELALGVTAWRLLGRVPWGHTAVILTGAVCLALSALHDPYNGPGCPATCCGCGNHTTELAVWGPDSPADRAEGYCHGCYRSVRPTTTAGFPPGSTVALVPPGLTWDGWDRESRAAWPARRLVDPSLLRLGTTWPPS